MSVVTVAKNATESRGAAVCRHKVPKVHGHPFAKLPKDLYVPPGALRVLLDTFEGPLDLLLYLIKRHQLPILEISICTVTEQYIAYTRQMQRLDLNLASEYLLMAATLADIKSRLLLPSTATEEKDEEDPRALLAARLREYECIKKAAEQLDALPRLARDVLEIQIGAPPIPRPRPKVQFDQLVNALRDVIQRNAPQPRYHLHAESMSIEAHMAGIIDRLSAASGFLPFSDLFTGAEGRTGLVATFMALLELWKGARVEIMQTRTYAPIHVRLAGRN